MTRSFLRITWGQWKHSKTSTKFGLTRSRHWRHWRGVRLALALRSSLLSCSLGQPVTHRHPTLVSESLAEAPAAPDIQLRDDKQPNRGQVSQIVSWTLGLSGQANHQESRPGTWRWARVTRMLNTLRWAWKMGMGRGLPAPPRRDTAAGLQDPVLLSRRGHFTQEFCSHCILNYLVPVSLNPAHQQ